jgi:hypothetical protein
MEVVRPRKGQVWAFNGGPRHDIVKRVVRIREGKRTRMFVMWESGMLTIPVRAMWSNFEHKGFFVDMSGRERETKELVSDLLELALDWKSDTPSIMDPDRQYMVCRNKAVELGYQNGIILPVE